MPSLYKFQEEALSDLLAGKRLCLLQTGAGKTAVMFRWLAKQSPKKVLVVTTPSKRDSGDMEAEADMWNGESWRKQLDSFEVVSWHGLHKWVKSHWDNLDEYAYAFDECLPADTQIRTVDGIKKIVDIKEGDLILSYNHAQGKVEYKKVTRTIKKSSPTQMIRLTLSNGTAIISTDNHPHFTQDGYKEAKEIVVGDTLYEMHDLWSTSGLNNSHGKKEIQLEAPRPSVLLRRVWEKIHGKNGPTTEKEGIREGTGSSWGSDGVCLLQKKIDARRLGTAPMATRKEERPSILFHRVRKCMEGGGCSEKSGHGKGRKVGEDSSLRNLRKRDTGCYNDAPTKDKAYSQDGNILLQRMPCRTSESGSPDLLLGAPERDSRENEDLNGRAQLVEYGGKQSKGASNEKKKWMEANLGKETRAQGGQRSLHRAAEKTLRGPVGCLSRVGDGATSKLRGKNPRLPNKLQVGHREPLLQNRRGVRWGWAQRRKSESQRRQKRCKISRVRVESVEVLELRDIKRLGLYRDPDYVYCLDVEDNHNFFANGVLTHNCAKAKAGVSSGMGKAFLRITGQTDCWTGYTATPGDNWLCFYPYFQACHLVRNKTAFKARYVSETFFKGYPDIIGYRHEDELLHMWKKISTSPDTSALNRELPSETHKVVEFKKPTGYDKAIKTRMTPEGEWLDTTMGLAHYLRELCFTKAKQQWLTDFLEGLGTQAVIFYSYIEEGDKIEALAKKALPKGAKVWRIDGAHHEIPTADTIGKYDVVVCQWQSGSEALNLQFMHYWVSTTPNYSYSTSLQARGRIKRIGQTESMFFYYLRCGGTIEDDIYKALSDKRSFSEDVWAAENGIDKKASA